MLTLYHLFLIIKEGDNVTEEMTLIVYVLTIQIRLSKSKHQQLQYNGILLTVS